MISRRKVCFSLASAGLVGAGLASPRLNTAFAQAKPPQFSRKPFAFPTADATKLIAAAEAQVGKTVEYDGAYAALKYPMGDIPLRTGVCTDVVIRAYREAFGIDLQQIIHEDMRQAFKAYPAIWGLKRPDKNIDHRRVPNMERFFARQNARLNTGTKGSSAEEPKLKTGSSTLRSSVTSGIFQPKGNVLTCWRAFFFGKRAPQRDPTATAT